jgi:hypothetical protein
MKTSPGAMLTLFATLLVSVLPGCGGGGAAAGGDVSCDSPASVTAVLKSDHLCVVYTGLTPSAAMSVKTTCESIGNIAGTSCDLKGAVAGCKSTSPNGDGTTFTTIRWAYDGTVASIMAACSADETLVMPSAGGGGGGQTSNANVSRFLGAWQPLSGTATMTCGAAAPITNAVDSDETWDVGTGSDLVLDAGGLKANVVASTATALPNQVLTETYGTISLTVTQKTYTFTLGADGLTAVEDQTFKYTSGADACDVTEHATYQKR